MRLLIDVPVHRKSLETLNAYTDMDIRIIESSEESRRLPSGVIEDREILLCTFPPSNLE